jgi:hypothetical protein
LKWRIPTLLGFYADLLEDDEHYEFKIKGHDPIRTLKLSYSSSPKSEC